MTSPSIALGIEIPIGPNDRRQLRASVDVDVPRLVQSRLLVNANSGGGKSQTVRRLLERTHGQVPHHVLDPEGEFHTLRERFDYVLAGRPGGVAGDCPAEPASAGLLARRLLALGVSAVIDLFELDPPDRILFVRHYLDGLLDAPRALWRPTLVVVDEAHTFCPERGEGEAQSRDAVIGLMARGRKRGFCGVLATQRMSKLHKSAAAEANNVLIGRTALDVDVDRAARVLGFDRHKRELLRHLHPGEFFAFGPAISDQVIKVLVGPVDTSHPEAGQGAQTPAPPPAAIQQAIAHLKDIPRQAQVERETIEGLRARVADLEGAAATPPASHALHAAIGRYRDDLRVRVANLHADLSILESSYDALVADTDRQNAAATRTQVVADQQHERVVLRQPDPTLVKEMTRADKLPRPQMAVLDALAWFEQLGVAAASTAQVAFIAGYTPTSGTFGNIRGRLHASGLVSYPGAGLTMLTAAGRERANVPKRPATTAALQAAILAKLDNPGRRLLEVLLEHGASPPRAPLHSDDLAKRTGYSPGSGTFGNIRGRLRSLGLIEYPTPGYVAPADILFLARGR
ncbi:MAG: DUF87 domain-containing protein [Thermomicrobiales bacterium]|nr:DUF87 domain-containing protein [Thermomicrobiales bacterium]